MTTREDEIQKRWHMEPFKFDTPAVRDIDYLLKENQRLQEEVSQSRIEITKLNQQIGTLKFQMSVKDSALRSVESIIRNSQGVTGWHMNGEIATWGELGLDEEIAEALPNENAAEGYRKPVKVDEGKWA